MPREYKSFEDLRKDVSDTFSAFCTLRDHLGWSILNKKGSNQFLACGALRECFDFSENKSDLVAQVAALILDIRVSIKEEACRMTNPKSFIEERTEVAELLQKYVRHNCERELWENVPEFKTPTE